MTSTYTVASLRTTQLRREPADADDGAEDGGEHDADDGHPQRVDEAFHVDVTDGLALVEVVARDLEVGRVVEEAEVGGDPARRHVLPVVAPQPQQDGGDHGEHRQLERP